MRHASASAGTSNPEDQALLLFAQSRQRGTVDPLRAKHVRVIDLQKLFRSECLRRAKYHVSRVMDDNVETAVFLDDLFDGLVADS